MTVIVGHLDIRKHDPDCWDILSRIKCIANDGRTVELLPPFTFDGGSIPRVPPLWSIVPPMGTLADYGWAFHDGLYAWHRDRSPLVIVSDPFTRKEADELMLEIHHYKKVSEAVAHGSYLAVRRGASWSWLTPDERAERSRKVEEQAFSEY